MIESRIMRFAALCLLISCAPAPTVDEIYDRTCVCQPRHGESGLAYDDELLWPRSSLNVCLDGGTRDQRLWVKDAVSRTWGAASALQITWQPCHQPGPVIQEVHLRIGDALELRGLGVQNNLLFPGVTVGTFYNGQFELRAQAVYAFGTILGFAPAEDRPDRPSDCRLFTRFPGHVLRTLGQWDPHSVMNDCSDTRYNGGMLSEGDITGIQRVYGEPKACGCGS